MLDEDLEDRLGGEGFESVIEALNPHGFDVLMGIREYNYASQQGKWQQLLHEQVTASSGARWLWRFCADATADTRLTRREYTLREATARGLAAHVAQQTFGYMDAGAYYMPPTSRMFRRIPHDLEDERGSRPTRGNGVLQTARQLEGLRDEIFNLLAQGRDIQGISYDTERITLHTGLGKAKVYHISEVAEWLHKKLGDTTIAALNINSKDVIGKVLGILFAGDQSSGRPYHAIVTDTVDKTRAIIEKGFRLTSPMHMISALNLTKRPNPYIKTDDKNSPELDLATDGELPDHTSSETATRESAGSLFDELERQLWGQKRPPLLTVINQSYDRLLDEARSLLLLEGDVPEEHVFDALSKSHLRQEDLLVRALGTVLSAKRELEVGTAELPEDVAQDLRAIHEYLDALPPLPKGHNQSDEISRLVAVVMSVLKPIRPYVAQSS